MVNVVIEGEDVVVQLSCWERFVGALCCCGGLRYPISNITSVRVSNNMWGDLRGLRVGLGIPYVVMLGSRARCDGRDFAYVSGNKPGIIIDFASGPVQRWNVCIENPEAFKAELEKKLGEVGGMMVAPAKVVE